jgi:RimJ/RimL family protein N-acetyltransferase
VIRPFQRADLSETRRILNAAFNADDSMENVGEWLEWSRLSARWLPLMRQFPYGDRAVIVVATGELIGVAGYVPMLMPFDQIPELARQPGADASGGRTPEVGLFWAIDTAHQRRGYATEAARALIDHAFAAWRLWRILAKTDYDNHASQAVMLKAGMTLTRNPRPEPPWMQVVGVRYATIL